MTRLRSATTVKVQVLVVIRTSCFHEQKARTSFCLYYCPIPIIAIARTSKMKSISIVMFLNLHMLMLLFDSLIVSALAWTQQQNFYPSMQSHSKKFRLYSSYDNDLSTSRRQWLAAVASAVMSVGSLPTHAADLIISDAVCDPGVSVWKRDNRLVYILGTAHISSASAKLAGDLVKDVHPKGVFVELDAKRVSGSGLLAGRLSNNMEGDGPTSRVIIPNIQRISMGNALSSSSSSSDPTSSDSTSSMLASGTVNSGPVPTSNPIMRAASKAVGNSIKSMYQKLDSAGFQAGEEFVVAIREGQTIGSDIVLGDRDVEVTLRRLTEGLARTDLQALMNPDSELEQSLKELVPSKVASSSSSSSRGDPLADLTDEEFREEFSTFVETMKAKENVRKVMVQLERLAPALYEALVSERDAYMAAGLNGLDELETVVAVMGVAHVDGVERNLAINGWKLIQPNCATKY